MESEQKLIRLLIINEGFHEAEKITSSLRATGMQVRAEFAEDGEDMCAMLDSKSLDLVLFSMDLPEFSLKQAQHLIQECGRHVSLVAMVKKLDANVLVNAINQGAQDVVLASSLDHLIQVIQREAYNINLWRKVTRLELDFQESEARCQNLLASSKDAVAYVHEGMHIFANEAYMELFGNADFDELEGTPIIDMVDSSQQNALKKFLRDLSQNSNDSNKLDLGLIHSSGETIKAQLEFSRASYDGEPCTQILIRSGSDTAELEEQINYLHQHDLITGLFNHQYFMDQLKKSITQAIGGKSKFVIIYIAIDEFQTIRDRVGISGCDTLVSDIAKIINKGASKDLTVARFGASSYACIGIIKDKASVENFASKIPKVVEQHISEIGNQSINATCSTAVVFLDENSPDNPNEIIARAEKTCVQIQSSGGNKALTYVPKEGERTLDEEDSLIAKSIKEALNKNRIKGLYQPIAGVKGQPGERYLSSLELAAEDGTTLLESDYIDAAERTGTAKLLDKWKVLHAIKKLSETIKKGRKIEFFIPLSADAVKDTGFALWISQQLTKAKVPGALLVFMVEETQAVNQLKAAKTLLKGLKQMHCKFAIDEFGAGQNPFQLIKHLDADYLRISHVYMENLAQNPDNQESIKALAEQAAAMKLSTITPGVNDASALSVLWTLNIDFIQGDFLQSPQRDLNYDFSSM